MKITTFIIDAFTNKAFSGNPAGVCLMETEIDEKTMQSIANELNLSETAFLHPTADAEQYNIRYFTPTVEIDFCGHATLASAKLILDKLGKKKAEFRTRKELKITATNQGEYIKMEFPLYETIDFTPNKALLDAFGIANPISLQYCTALDMLLIEVKEKQDLLDIAPNFQKALESSKSIKELVVSTKSEDDEYDFYSRCFCPWLGINEDPVTGAAHSVLAKYWGKKLGKQKMSAFQLSTRGGFLHLEIVNDSTLNVFSQAQIVFEGTLSL